jgi:hypothetical protein
VSGPGWDQPGYQQQQQAGTPDPAWNGQPRLTGSERDELSALRQQYEYHKKREARRTWWRPGMPLPESEEPQLGTFENDYKFEVAERTRIEAIRAEARRALAAEEEALARGSRRDLSWADLTALPKPVWVLPGRLTAGWHGMAGPPEAGKSLAVRNWCCEVGAGGRAVVYALSEGHFDLEDRFAAHSKIEVAGPHLRFFDGGMNLASPSDVTWFLGAYGPREPALVVFDMIYGSASRMTTASGTSRRS